MHSNRKKWNKNNIKFNKKILFSSYLLTIQKSPNHL